MHQKAKKHWRWVLHSAVAFILTALPLLAEPLPAGDQRAGPPKTLDTLRTFPEIKSKAAWEARGRTIREHVLVCCGLWPMPEKTPLHAQIFGRIEREGYSIEKVFFQTYPGFYLAGNLYRPRGQGTGPFPGVLNPHGHWKNGRMADTDLGSIAGRCINFARQGMVAFSYDMAGYNDTAQVSHKFATNPTNLLWNISLMGLQTWNSIRALDFLESLPDVDKRRLACTGESGGGTQTFMLGAVEDRLAAQAPIVMVSHSMQGGCLCENAPGLRVEYSNMEIAAVPAPRPQILVAATGDWTKMTLTIEGPAIAGIYRLFHGADKLRYVIFDFDHNYNRTTREAVYQWFGKCLLHHRNPESLTETAFQKEPDEALRVWPKGNLPEDALSEGPFIGSMVSRAQAQLLALKPADKSSLKRFKKVMFPAWQHTLQVELPDAELVVENGRTQSSQECTETAVAIGRAGKGDRLPNLLITPARSNSKWIAVLAHPEGKAFYCDANGGIKGLARELLRRQCPVVLVDTFLTGDLANPSIAQARKPTSSFFSTYNRTDLQERVQDLITTCAFARARQKHSRVVLIGEGRAGLWSLLAAPAADAVAADCAGLELTDAELLEPDLFAPGLRKLGAFQSAALLAAPNPLLVHHVAPRFPTAWLEQTYAAIHAKDGFRREEAPLSPEAVGTWIAGLKAP